MGERAKPRPFLTFPNRTSLECNHSILELWRFHFGHGLRITSGNSDVPESPIALVKVFSLQVVFLNILVEIVLFDQNLRFLSFLIFNFCFLFNYRLLLWFSNPSEERCRGWQAKLFLRLLRLVNINFKELPVEHRSVFVFIGHLGR